jgi:threonine dehydratase
MTQFTDAARAAACALRELFLETPLQRNDHLCQLYDADIWLKREDLSPVRSYKLRGAFTALRKHLGGAAGPAAISLCHRLNQPTSTLPERQYIDKRRDRI